MDGTPLREGWELTAAAGLAMADGNASSLSYTLQLLATQISADHETYLGANHFYGDNQGVTTSNSLNLFGQHNRSISDRMYYGLGGNFLNDDVADIAYRFDINPVIGYHVLKSDSTKLSFDFGPGYTWEEQGGVANDYLNLRLGQKFEWIFSSRAKFWQSFTITAEAAEMDNYLFVGEIGIDTLITPNWSLRTFVRHQYDNTPASDRQAGDTTAMVGLAYSLGGFPEPAAPGRRTLKADRAPSPVNAMGWASTASLGYSLASGNADNSNITGMFDTSFRSEENEFFFNATANYGENAGQASINNIRAESQYNYLFTPRCYAGLSSGFQRDDLADLNYRFTPTVMAGYYLLKNSTSTLRLEAGPGYTIEDTNNGVNDFLSIQAAERFVYALSPRCTFNQSLVYNADAVDAGNEFIITASAFLDTDITDKVALRVAAAWIYDNTPALGRERHDTTLSTGIAVKF
jgi:putative salt-induced outer membrane protein